MTINSELKGRQLLLYTKKLHEIIDACVWESENYVLEPFRFYDTIIYKISSLLDTAGLLIFNIDNKPHYIDTLYLSLRTCMLDNICLLHVFDVHEDLDEAKNRVLKIMSDHVKAFYKSANTKEERADVRMRLPEFFNGDSLIDNKSITANYMKNKIQNYPSLKREADHSFYLYTIFSKIEHNGFFTRDMLHGHHLDEGRQKAKELIIEAVGNSIVIVNTILLVWIKDTDPKYVSLFNLAKDFLYVNDLRI
ncbi:MAG: hypothetical protein EOO89_00270 [Pedobacter sp.]|nr:MAG: hypothetical protein EOO89_00270 [Pedobacter sp.]